MGKKKSKDKVKHVKHWKSTKPYNRGKIKIIRGKYLSKNVVEVKKENENKR
jgi:hypothetical protein